MQDYEGSSVRWMIPPETEDVRLLKECLGELKAIRQLLTQSLVAPLQAIDGIETKE